MQVAGKTIISMGQDMRSFRISVFIRVIMSTGNLKEWADTHGQMGNFMKDSG